MRSSVCYYCVCLFIYGCQMPLLVASQTNNDDSENEVDNRHSTMMPLSYWNHLTPAYRQSLNINPDKETVEYILPKLAAKYRPNAAWFNVNDPRFYILSEFGKLQRNNNDMSEEMENQEKRSKLRKREQFSSQSLSIVQPLDVLRQRMLLEIQRKKVLDQVQQAHANRLYLSKIGKRTQLALRNQDVIGKSANQLAKLANMQSNSNSVLQNPMQYDDNSLANE